MDIERKTSKLAKYEWAMIAFSLAIASVFVPLLVSAASTVLNIIGFSLICFFLVWTYKFFQRIANNNF